MDKLVLADNQLCADTGCNLEDLQRAMDGWNREREREKERERERERERIPLPSLHI